MTDPISDMLTRIRNAMAVSTSTASLPHSKLKEDVAKVLARTGFLKEVKVSSGAKSKIIEITINDSAEAAAITNIKRLSRPGQRHYVSAAKIPSVKHGRGLVVISTSHGIMSGAEAKAKNLGGELICEVY